MLSAVLLLAARLTLPRVQGSIVLDGDLSDSGWTHALKIDAFVEIAKNDNAAPPARTIVYLTYDDH